MSREAANVQQASAVKKQLKGLSKNDLIRVVLALGNDIGLLKAQNEALDAMIQELKGDEDERSDNSNS